MIRIGFTPSPWRAQVDQVRFTFTPREDYNEKFSGKTFVVPDNVKKRIPIRAKASSAEQLRRRVARFRVRAEPVQHDHSPPLLSPAKILARDPRTKSLNPRERAAYVLHFAREAAHILNFNALRNTRHAFSFGQITDMFDRGKFARKHDRHSPGEYLTVTQDRRYGTLAQLLGLQADEFLEIVEQAQGLGANPNSTIYDRYATLLSKNPEELNPVERAQRVIVEAMLAKGIKTQLELVNACDFNFDRNQIFQMLSRGHFPRYGGKYGKFATQDWRYKSLAQALGLGEEEFCQVITQAQKFLETKTQRTVISVENHGQQHSKHHTLNMTLGDFFSANKPFITDLLGSRVASRFITYTTDRIGNLGYRYVGEIVYADLDKLWQDMKEFNEYSIPNKYKGHLLRILERLKLYPEYFENDHTPLWKKPKDQLTPIQKIIMASNATDYFRRRLHARRKLLFQSNQYFIFPADWTVADVVSRLLPEIPLRPSLNSHRLSTHLGTHNLWSILEDDDLCLGMNLEDYV